MIKVIGIGAGGHAKVVIEILKQHRGYSVVGLLDSDKKLHGKKILGVPVLGDDAMLGQLKAKKIKHVFIGLGGVGDLVPRRRLFEKARALGFAIVNAIHPSAVVSPSATVGAGVTIMAGAIINAEAVLGENVIVNTGAIVEHDCVIGSHAHVATAARLASTVVVGEQTHIGLGASIKQCVKIGKRAVVGAGAVVITDVAADTVVVGVPAKPISRKA